MTNTRLIVGLGNPGKDYEYTRHNIGFLVVRRLAERLDFKFKESSLTKGLLAEGVYDGTGVCLLMPLTFMNHSGQAVKKVLEKKGIPLEHLLVVSDDFHLSYGQLRLRPEGSDGGHNGLGSVIQELGAEEFPRLRLGIGRPKVQKDLTDYVLGEFTKQERKMLGQFTDLAGDGCLGWAKDGIKKAMDQFNQRKENGK